MRKVLVFSTVGAQEATIETDVTTWGELQGLILSESVFSNIQFNKMIVLVKETKNTLESMDAILPEGDFTIYIRQRNAEKGVAGTDKMSFKELRGLVKELLLSDGDRFKSYIGNYTQMSTEALRAALKNYKSLPAKKSTTKKTVVKKETAKAASKKAVKKVVVKTATSKVDHLAEANEAFKKIPKY